MKHALEEAQQIEEVWRKDVSLLSIAFLLATESILKKRRENSIRRMKKAFTPKEKLLAKQLVETTQGN